MQSGCVCGLCHLSAVSDLFVLNYITGWNVIVAVVFLYCRGGAANHSYMLQRIYNCVVLCVCVFNGISEVLWAKNTHDFKFTIMVCAPSLRFFIYFKNCLLIKF